MIRITNEYSLGCVGVAAYGQRYGGTIKLTSPEAFGMPYLDSRFEQFERRTDYVDVYIHMPVLALFLGNGITKMVLLAKKRYYLQNGIT